MDYVGDYIYPEDTGSTSDLPPLEEDTDNADDVDFDEALIPTVAEKKSAEILIEIDEDHKKVITLQDGGYDSLVELFFEAVADDPVLEEYAGSTFVFRIFSQKFNTWVDLDRSKELIDGSRLKAIFLTQTEQDTESKHKRRKSSKRRLADSSENCCDHNCNSKTCCSSHDNVGAKRICETIKTCVTDAGKNSVTSFSMHSHDLVDLTDSSRIKQVSESHSVSPALKGELHDPSLGLSDKNPISALHELCTKFHWEKPVFEMHEQDVTIPDPKFLMKVTVRGQTYIPDKYERRKQSAKATAAEFCLKQLGAFK